MFGDSAGGGRDYTAKLKRLHQVSAKSHTQPQTTSHDHSSSLANSTSPGPGRSPDDVSLVLRWNRVRTMLAALASATLWLLTPVPDTVVCWAGGRDREVGPPAETSSSTSISRRRTFSKLRRFSSTAWASWRSLLLTHRVTQNLPLQPRLTATLLSTYRIQNTKSLLSMNNRNLPYVCIKDTSKITHSIIYKHKYT